MLVLSMLRFLISFLIISSKKRGAKVSVLFYHIRAERSYCVWAAGSCSWVPALLGQRVDQQVRGCILMIILGYSNFRRHPSGLLGYHNLCRHPLSLWSCTNSSHLGDLTDQACNLLRRRCHPQSWSKLVNSNIFPDKTFPCSSLVASVWTFPIWFLLFPTKFPRRWSPVRFPSQVPVECPRLPEHLLG